LALLHGREPDPVRNHSLRADLGILILNPKGAPPLSGRLFASADSSGNVRFRLDIFGFPSLLAASWFQSANQWTLMLPQRREVWEGKGESMTLSGLGPESGDLTLPAAEGLFGFLFGHPLIGFDGRDSVAPTWSGDTLRWIHRGVGWAATYDTAHGICRQVFSPTLRVRYGRYRRQGNRAVPREVEIEMDGRPALSLRVNGLEDVTVWKRDPFAFSIPEGYQVHRRDPEGSVP
jgi:hypothetical protein